MAQITPPDRPRQRSPRIRTPKHLIWIRTLPCLISGREIGIEAAHVRYGDPRHNKRPTGMAERPDDRWAVPLCHQIHRTGPGAQHRANERVWWASRMIDPLAIAAALWNASGDDEIGRLIIWRRF